MIIGDFESNYRNYKQSVRYISQWGQVLTNFEMR